VPSTYKAQEYVLTNGAPSSDARALHVYVRFSKALSCTAVRTLCLCGRNVHCEYLAQFTGSRVAVEVVGGKESHFRSPVEPKRLRTELAAAVNKSCCIAATANCRANE
jgi:hypothetical protein